MSEPIVGAIYRAEVGGYRLAARDHSGDLFSVDVSGKGVWPEDVLRDRIKDGDYELVDDVELRVVPKSLDIIALREKLTKMVERLDHASTYCGDSRTREWAKRDIDAVAAELRELEATFWKEES
jgi:hypothetical protein